MKKFLVGLIGLIAVFIIIVQLLPDKLSVDQKNTRELFGNPQQFVITYLPRGTENNPQLVRSEVWFYPNQEKKVSFLAGKLVYSEDYRPEEKNIEPTKLKPEDFYYEQTADDVAEIIGREKIEPVDYLPGFYEKDELQTYFSEQVVFVIEQDHLTYIQTVGLGDKKIDEVAVSQKPEKEITASDWKTYFSSDFGFSVDYPQDWFLDYDVLSSYDINYLNKNLPLPEKKIKCDFINYNPKDAEMIEEKQIIDSPVSILQGKGKDNSGVDGPGLGDNVFFLFQDESHDSVGLLCFAYDQSFEEKLIEMLKTFRFLD